jgi:hypothetical protein
VAVCTHLQLRGKSGTGSAVDEEATVTSEGAYRKPSKKKSQSDTSKTAAKPAVKPAASAARAASDTSFTSDASAFLAPITLAVSPPPAAAVGLEPIQVAAPGTVASAAVSAPRAAAVGAALAPPAVLPSTLVAAAATASLPVVNTLPSPPAATGVGSLLRGAIASVIGTTPSPTALVEAAPGAVAAHTKAVLSTAAEGTLPEGVPPAPAGLPLLQWVDKYEFATLGAPAPADLPPGPPNLSQEQWAAKWVYAQQQAQQQAAQNAAAGAAAAAPAPGTGPGQDSLTMRSLASYDALAVCNDGSPGAFYYSPGTDPTTWVVFLQGGMWCWDAESCSQRALNGPGQVSSASWPAVMTQGGLFDTDPSLNPFASANKVYLAYCSSDAWVGDVSAETTQASHGFSWAFRGRRILRATLDVLVSDLGLGGGGASASKPHRLLLAGCSAGARGAMFNLDAVRAAAPPTVQVQGLLDSPEWIDVQPLDPSVVSLGDQCASALGLFNASGVLNPQCVAAQPANSSYLCLMGQYAMLYLNTPYFLNAAQFDAFQIPYNVGGMPSLSNAADVTYCNNWQDTLLSAINPLPTASQTNSGVFSLSCLRHCLTQGPAFWSARILNTSLATAAGSWFYEGTGSAKYFGNCQTYPRCVMC